MAKERTNEKAIIAGFTTLHAAQQAQKALNSLNVIDLNIDRISEHPVTDWDTRLHNPITGRYPGLANAVYNTTFNRDQSVLVSADPSASGMSAGGDKTNMGTDIVLTVVVDNKDYEEAMAIIKKHGGMV